MSTSETNRTSTPRTRAAKPDSAARPRAATKSGLRDAAKREPNAGETKTAVTGSSAKRAPDAAKAAKTGNGARPPKAAAKTPRRKSESDTDTGSMQREPTPRADSMDAHEWHRLVSEAAYYRAERRGFINGSPEQDWLEAEEEVRRTRQRAGE